MKGVDLKGVYKYEPHWQLARCEARKLKTVEEKLARAKQYYELNNTFEGWARVYNWLHGLALGYKSRRPEEYSVVMEEAALYELEMPGVLTRHETLINPVGVLGTFGDKLLIIYKDLYQRHMKWLRNGYCNQELSSFILVVVDAIHNSHLEIPDRISYSSIQREENLSRFRPSSHKFIY